MYFISFDLNSLQYYYLSDNNIFKAYLHFYTMDFLDFTSMKNVAKCDM